MKFKSIVFAIALSFCSLSLFGQTIALADQDLSEKRTATFERVWNLVNDRHFDPTFGGVDWKKVGESYKPLAMAAKTDTEFHAVLNRMLGELNQSHFSIYTKESEADAARCNDGVVGIDVKLLTNKVIISKIEKNSPAELAGLKTGFEIVKIDQREIPEVLLNIENSLAARKVSDSMGQTYRERTLLRAMCGLPNSQILLEAIDGKRKHKTYSITRLAFKGETAKVADGIPPFKLFFEAKRPESNIGYVAFNVWIPKQAERARDAIREMMDLKGIIIDLRGNAGGQGNLVNTLGGILFSEPTSLGTTKTRFGSGKFIVQPQKKIYEGKIVILTDRGTGSTSEIFAGGMQDSGRATIIGERTAGAVLPANIERLPTGANFMYAIADYRTPKGILLEGVGVKPDNEVALTQESLLSGRDLQMEEAMRAVRSVIEE